MSVSRREEYERLRGLINQWNIDHYDIFELSQPNEHLEFHGVVRFFFQGGIGASVITKCIRVSSTASTREVIDVLIEKFRPDMRMLNQNKYALYEVHVNGEERRLADDEKPLYVQLNWGTDVREGRFLLRNEDHPTVRDPALGFDKSVLQQDQSGFERSMSKRASKKKQKKQRGKENAGVEEGVANKLYEDAPETSFTRSISNPEAVMKRRRQQKLEKKLAQMSTIDGGSEGGGTLKIYGSYLRPDVPYKTLFLSRADPASAVVREALEKYGLEKEDPNNYCLIEVLLPPGGMEYHGEKSGDERVLDDNECPLAIVIQHANAKHRGHGHIIFQLRERSADYMKRKQKPRSVSHEDLRMHPSDQRHTNVEMLPYLIEMNVRGKPKRQLLPINVTEVVNVTEVANNKPDYNGKHFLQLSGSDIRPRHCVIAHTEGIVTVTPNSQNAETYVEGQRIYETTMLKHGMTVQFGKERLYKFLDPRFEDSMKSQSYQQPMKGQRGQPQETNFDVDGRVETVRGVSPRLSSHSWESQQRSISDRSPGSSIGSHGLEDSLPASVESSLDAQDRLLQACILEVRSKQLQFKLAPTYTLYLTIRHLLTARSLVAHQGQLVTDIVNKTANMIQQSIQEHHNDPSSLAFWMANSSESLHMYKQDRDIRPLSGMSQEMLAEAVQTAFHHLVRCLQGDLQRVMPAFLDPSDASDRDDEVSRQYNMARPTLGDVLDTLTAAMTLLRRCRVNAALTIQLFSQLFHFINMWLFNILVTEPQLQLCTRVWGLRLKRRLGSVEAWAEKQGLELAADCHLCRIIQAAHLLQAPKFSSDDITNISSTCFKLNSLQLRALLTRYIPEQNEPAVSASFVDRVVSIAENMADELTRTDGREVRLEEDSDLHLPFLLPEDGYSCDNIRGIPSGLPEFVKQLESVGLCKFIVNSSSSGSWTVYMQEEQSSEVMASSPGHGLPPTPEVFTISFKKVKGSMGLSIVAAMGEGQPEQGIYIKSVVDGGAAALDGRLQAGDQLLEVDGKSLVGVTQEKAAEMMTKTGQVVKLKVAKRAVLYHNLGSLLSQPSPTSQRAAQNKAPLPVRAFSEEGPPPPYNGQANKAINGYGNSDRMRAPSTGNLANSRAGGFNDPYASHRDNDPRSKSTSNLLIEANQDRGDMYPSMKQAQSVGVLHPSFGQAQFSPGDHRQDSRPNDYENQPSYTQGADQNQLVRPTSLHSAQGYLQPQKTSDRSSVSSRTSSNSNRDMKPQSTISKDPRPQSAYYHPNNTNWEDQDISRPRSEDVGSKLKEWQEKYKETQGGYSKSPVIEHSPPYSNIGAQNREPPPQPKHNPPPKPTAHERLFGQSSAPQKVNNITHNRQPHFYENTTPRQVEHPPAFHQLHRHVSENDMRPRQIPKSSSVPPKNNWPRVQHVDMPNVRIDSRQTQPHFYGTARPSPSPHGYPSSPHVVQQPSFPQSEQRNQQFDQRNDLQFDQQSNQFDQRNNQQFDQRNNQFDQRNQQYDQRNQYDQKILPQHKEERNQAHIDFRNDPRFAQDLRNAPDPRNGSLYEQRDLLQDPQDIVDLRTAPDPRNIQQPSVQDVYSQPQDVHQVVNSLSPTQNKAAQQSPYFQQQQRLAGITSPRGFSSDLLPVPRGMPQADSYQDDLPPLPPPPSHEALIEQKLAEEQQKLMLHINATNQFLASDPRHERRYSPNTTQPTQYQPPSQQQQFQPPSQPQQFQPPSQKQQFQPAPQQHQFQPSSQQQQFQPASQQRYQTKQQPSVNRVLPPGIDARDSTPLGYQVIQDGYRPNEPESHPNYQNISFVSAVRAAAGPEPQAPPVPQPPSEYYPYSNPSLKTHEYQVKPAVPASKPKLQQNRNETNNRSAWDRDAKEKAREEEQEELFRARKQEIADLESKSYLSPQDQERLRKLRMEQEFQRRVKEVAENGDEYEYEDAELAERISTRERLIQSLREDLEKSRERMRDFELTQRSTDASREYDRLQTLERRLEIYEKEREEQRQRLQRKQEKKAKEHQDNKGLQRESERRQDPLNRFDGLPRSDNLRGSQQGQGHPISELPSSASADLSALAPPPPERRSSYETFTHHQQRASFRESNSADFPPPPAALTAGLPSAMKNSSESQTKKSVSFNTQMNSYKDRTPSHSISSYRSPTGSLSSDQEFPPPPNLSLDVDVFESNVPSLPHANNFLDNRDEFVSNTPNVIGTQEIYRDPRSRIEAKNASQSAGRGTDRMSFREKMKYFATEAGEDTIKLKPKSSKTLRQIESQLNGQ